MEVLAVADAIILKYLELPSTLKKRVFGNGRFMLENGDHCHFLKPLSSKRLFREANRKMNWRYLKRIITKACSQPSADSEWKQWMENQQTGVVAGENMTLLVQKYGDICDILGHGSFGAVFLSHKIQEWNPNIHRFYAVKVFRREAQTTETAYQRRVESEFYISSSLQHQNIVRTFELLRIGNDSFCECLEYCSGRDLHSLVATSGQLEEPEADCFFKQLMRGVSYIHKMGIAHRDLKPENLLLSTNGCLKISDFGSAECFRLGWENQIHMSRTRRGSRPFVSPEQYLCEEFDPRSVDIWAAAMTYLVIRTGRIPWKIATDQDESFRDYVADLTDFPSYLAVVLTLQQQTASRRVIYSMLDIENVRRPIAPEILDSRWLQETKTCTAAGS
ncbi:serine/threonine-protein kinase HAL4/sat4 [Penicillium crustosum]|uniref:serine/threonine-protein kinase HAL4/sat4 n=1 Tax=Penicillium crustosum TaxID=36656 RepID=UPI00239A1D84|nr:serine/threonine-protein kinase HAL4/sat4 [Penicillium crustosum]KAJ5409968.1 serine/threonine-protein kinase HAL4/sat4 [Penicillium crustosum]